MAVLGVVIGLDRTHSHRLYHIMYLTPPPPHLTHACPRTLINHLAFLIVHPLLLYSNSSRINSILGTTHFLID